jgi:hypothetical protein
MYLDITDGQAVMQGQAHSQPWQQETRIRGRAEQRAYNIFFRSVAQSPDQCCRSALTESPYHFWRQLL